MQVMELKTALKESFSAFLEYRHSPKEEEANLADLSSYMQIGQMFRKEPSDEFTQIKTVLCNAVKTGQNVPFVFICSSSGTGKTQIPFSLDTPLLYFVYNVAQETQSNYQITFLRSYLLMFSFN